MTEVLFDFLNLLLQLLLVALDNSWISEINNHKVLRKLSYIWIWSNQLTFRYAFSFRRHLITYFDVAILVFASYSPIMFLWQVHPVLIYTDFWIKMFVLPRIIFFYIVILFLFYGNKAFKVTISKVSWYFILWGYV